MNSGEALFMYAIAEDIQLIHIHIDMHIILDHWGGGVIDYK
jgi:hypothetical protein